MLLLNKYLNGKIAEMIEHGIVALSALLIGHGVKQSDATGFTALINPDAIAGCIVGGLNLAWSMWRANAGNKLVSAVQSNDKGGQIMATATAKTAVLLFLFVGLAANAQMLSPGPTNSPAPLSTNAVISVPGIKLGGILPTNITTAANDVLPMIEQIVPYLTNITGVSVDLDGIYSTGNKLGGLLGVNVAVPGATNYLSMGVAAEYIGKDFYISPVDVKLGISYTIPYINIPSYSFVANGLSDRISDGAVGDQTLIGDAVVLNLGKQWYIVADGGRLLLTQQNSPANNWFGGVRIGKSW